MHLFWAFTEGPPALPLGSITSPASLQGSPSTSRWRRWKGHKTPDSFILSQVSSEAWSRALEKCQRWTRSHSSLSLLSPQTKWKLLPPMKLGVRNWQPCYTPTLGLPAPQELSETNTRKQNKSRVLVPTPFFRTFRRTRTLSLVADRHSSKSSRSFKTRKVWKPLQSRRGTMYQCHVSPNRTKDVM